MAFISTITLPSGSTYDIKDAGARTLISELTNAVSGGVHYKGVTSTVISDGSETQTVSIDGTSYTAQGGDLVIYGESEFIWSPEAGTNGAWKEFGSTGSLKSLAFKDTASGDFTPSGSVSQPTFTGTEISGLTVSAAASGTATYTPEGSISQPTFSGTAGTVTATYTPTGSVSISKAASGTANYTPSGSVSQPTFSGTEATVVVSGGSGTSTYTPAGLVSKPDITVTPSNTTVNSITDVGTLPSLSTTVSNENLTIDFAQGTLPTKGSDTSVMTGASAALNDNPTFSGTGTRLTATYTPAGSVSQPSFTGDGAVLTGSFSGSEATISGDYTPEGTVSQPTFSRTGKRLELQNYTPAGTVSQPTFSGTTGTVTVS